MQGPHSDTGADLDLKPSDCPPPQVLVFNANDPTAAGGLSADTLAIASVGARACPVVTGVLIRDTTTIHEHLALDAQIIAEQAQAVAQDFDLAAIRVGFAGSPMGVRAAAEFAGDFETLPIIVSVPDLSWCEAAEIESYLDALADMLLPVATVLVGNYNALWRWLLEDWASDRPPSARDIAAAAAARGAAHVLVTGMPHADSSLVTNALASPEQTLLSEQSPRLDARFIGAGDTLAAALAGGMATGMSAVEASREALSYLQACLQNGHVPGMGAAVPEPLFWAQPSGQGDDPDLSGADSDVPSSLAANRVWVQGPTDDTPRH